MKRISRLLIFASGSLSTKTLLPITPTDFIIGVDHASYWLIQNKVIPHLAIGDFDSVTPQEFEIIKSKSKEIMTFSMDKDFTDLELAVNKAILLKPKSVKIYGSLGTRLDHSLISIQLLEKLLKNNIPATIINDTNKCIISDSTTKIKKDKNYKYLSILPVSKHLTLSISGCSYNLDKAKITRSLSLCVSNEIISDSATITIHRGLALIIQSRD
jgi:thiamine pyrophosphokinase